MVLAREISTGLEQRRNVVVVFEVLCDSWNTLVAQRHRADEVHVGADQREKGREEKQHVGHGGGGGDVWWVVVVC